MEKRLSSVLPAILGGVLLVPALALAAPPPQHHQPPPPQHHQAPPPPPPPHKGPPPPPPGPQVGSYVPKFPPGARLQKHHGVSYRVHKGLYYMFDEAMKQWKVLDKPLPPPPPPAIGSYVPAFPPGARLQKHHGVSYRVHKGLYYMFDEAMKQWKVLDKPLPPPPPPPRHALPPPPPPPRHAPPPPPPTKRH